MFEKYGIFIKQHNTDYLSTIALSVHPGLRIHAANVAPEFGVAETKAFLDICVRHNLTDEVETFITLAVSSGKWKKWMIPGNKSSDRYKAIIAGHYIFSNPEFIQIKKEAENILKSKNIILNTFLKEQVKNSIFRYLKNFRLAS